jgi:hypothetical protein
LVHRRRRANGFSHKKPVGSSPNSHENIVAFRSGFDTQVLERFAQRDILDFAASARFMPSEELIVYSLTASA